MEFAESNMEPPTVHTHDTEKTLRLVQSETALRQLVDAQRTRAIAKFKAFAATNPSPQKLQRAEMKLSNFIEKQQLVFVVQVCVFSSW